jgi:phenylacetate-CoA ligase
MGGACWQVGSISAPALRALFACDQKRSSPAPGDLDQVERLPWCFNVSIPARPVTLGIMQPPFDAWRSCTVAADVAMATHADRAALSARRAQRLGALLAAAVRGSALYRKMLKGRTLADLQLQQLPVVHKRDLMHHFDDWVTDPELRLTELRRFTADPTRVAEPYLGRYVVWESSGSSGEPGIFVQDAQAMAVYDALEALRRPAQPPLQRWLDPWGLRERIAFVGAIGGHFASAVSVERLRRLNPVLSARLHSVSFLQPAHQLVAELDALAPTVITTYPSAAVLLAGERLAGRLKCSPREVWTGGETLTPSMREFVQRAFGCIVVNSYGASEFLSLACECAHGCLHLNSDWAILESVDERGRPVPEGEAGFTTLLTHLANHVQPLIRYDIGDRVTLHAQPCACGSMLPVIDVEGRSDDTLRLGAPGTAPVCVLPLAVSTVLEDDAGLFDFQLVQQGPCELLLRTALHGAEATATLRRARTVLAAFLAAQGAVGVQIRCRSGEPGQRGRSGKVMRVIALPP